MKSVEWESVEKCENAKKKKSAEMILPFSFGNAPARHRGLPGPSGPEPQKSPKRVRKGPARGAPESPKSAPRSLRGVQKESARRARETSVPGRGVPNFSCCP